MLAPAGWGKTTLLNEWRSSPSDERAFAWLSLDPGDNDPVKLFEEVIAALRMVEPGIGGEALGQLAGPAGLTEVVLPSLINELAALERPLVLALDDYHLVQSGRAHEAMAFLLDHAPPTLQVALAPRAEPPLPLARLRVRRQLVEVRADDLRFTDDEASALLGDALGFELDRSDVARLQERTEGWAAGLHLAALSLDRQENASAFISSIAGDDRPVVDYLGFEVLDGQPDDVREFLLRTSVLERLTGPLCDAVAGSSDSAAMLDRLERAGLFLVPLDAKRRWYRCHHLFRGLLRHELGRAEPGLVPELHRLACAWYRERGAASEAIHHAIAAGEAALASDLITEHWYAFLQRGRIETVAGWLDALGDEAVRADAGLCLTKAWIGVNTGRLEDVRRWIDAAELAAERSPEDPVVASGIASLYEIHRYMNGDVTGAVEAGLRSVERGDTPWRPVGCPVLGIALFWSGRPGDATVELEHAVRLADSSGNHLAVIHASAGLAAIHAEAGDLRQGDELAARALALAEERSLDRHWATAMARVVRGRALEDRGRAGEAGEEIGRAAELARRGVAAVEIAYSLLWQAQLAGASGTAAGLVAEARGVVEGCPDPGILSAMLVQAERRLRPAAREPASAGKELTARELDVLRLMAGELSQRAIGEALYLSLNTIKTHTRLIYRKLGVCTRAEAVERGRELGLL